MKLEIAGIVESAERIRQKISDELPSHKGLAGAVDQLVRSARDAKLVSNRTRRLFSTSRLPAVFLGLALLAFLVWAYCNFFYTPTISVAVPKRDFTDQNLKRFRKSNLKPYVVQSSKESLAAVENGNADLAFVQAGIPIEKNWTVLQTPSYELTLWLTRKGIQSPLQVTTVLTSSEEEGSHSVAKDFFRKWDRLDRIRFLHDWSKIGEVDEETNEVYGVPPEVDGVFVVTNVSDPSNQKRVRYLLEQGFEFRSPYLGIHAMELIYPEEFVVPKGYISQNPIIPQEDLIAYRVPDYLVARNGVSPTVLASVSKTFDARPQKLQSSDGSFNATDASEVFQGIEAFLGILINIVLAFLALLGLEVWTYRKRFHELNSLVSLLSMLQSNKDILDEEDIEKRSENLRYLSTVSDVLGLISAVNGYYTQENSSLLYNNQSQVIHERCDNLKLNIQLKILHAGIRLEKPNESKKSLGLADPSI